MDPPPRSTGNSYISLTYYLGLPLASGLHIFDAFLPLGFTPCCLDHQSLGILLMLAATSFCLTETQPKKDTNHLVREIRIKMRDDSNSTVLHSKSKRVVVVRAACTYQMLLLCRGCVQYIMLRNLLRCYGPFGSTNELCRHTRC